ncbi:MAG: SDR family oxidoreductase [Pseudomonadota bacterium]
MAQSAGTAIVLGGAKGVGLACARAFVNAHWSCLLADRDAKALAAAVDELGGGLAIYAGELDARIGLRNALAAVLEAHGRVDVVIHIPDLPGVAEFLDVDSECFEDKATAAAKDVTAAIRIFAAQMLSQGASEGRVALDPRTASFIQVFGTSAISGDPGRYLESASQSMALAAAQSAALELTRHKLRSNAIIAVRPRAERDEPWLKQRTPLGRHSHAEEIGEAALFLASSAAANMTGQTLVLDGGRSRLNGVLVEDE